MACLAYNVPLRIIYNHAPKPSTKDITCEQLEGDIVPDEMNVIVDFKTPYHDIACREVHVDNQKPSTWISDSCGHLSENGEILPL